jgi:hypothetical protein
MHYRLRENLSCCDIDGHLIFLDVAQDRYFKLTGVLEKAMRRFQSHEDVAPTMVESLVAARILIEVSNPEARSARADIQRPVCSALEQPSAVAGQRIDMAIAFEVIAIVWSTHHQLKTCALKVNLDKASAYRDRKTDAAEDATPAATKGRLLQANGQFARARRYVPIEPTCLLDSLSLLRFLSRRRLPANIVFGVAPEPFTAHCWVQAGDMALNETLSDANAHTPIMKV